MTKVRRMISSLGALKLGASALVGGLAIGGACGGPNPGDCRGDPFCNNGGIGAFCDGNSECFDGYCCEKKGCNEGMCTYRCDNDSECPSNMGCEHDVCFFRCGGDGDCLNGQECKHDGVCEWE